MVEAVIKQGIALFIQLDINGDFSAPFYLSADSSRMSVFFIFRCWGGDDYCALIFKVCICIWFEYVYKMYDKCF